MMIINGDAKLIAAAFIKARSEMSATVTKDAKGNYGKYMTLAALVEATTAALAHHGLAIVQEAGTDENGVTVATWLIHESGAIMQFGTLTMPLVDRKPQAVGSALTYGRRYALAAVCGIAPDDDDGQGAQDTYNKPRQHQAPRPPSAQKAAEPSNASNEGDVLFTPETSQQGRPVASEAQLKRLHILGTDAYGSKAEWDTHRPKLVEWVSKGAVTSSKELAPAEADTLIRGLEKRLKEIEAERQPAAA